MERQWHLDTSSGKHECAVHVMEICPADGDRFHNRWTSGGTSLVPRQTQLFHIRYDRERDQSAGGDINDRLTTSSFETFQLSRLVWTPPNNSASFQTPRASNSPSSLSCLQRVEAADLIQLHSHQRGSGKDQDAYISGPHLTWLKNLRGITRRWERRRVDMMEQVEPRNTKRHGRMGACSMAWFLR